MLTILFFRAWAQYTVYNQKNFFFLWIIPSVSYLVCMYCLSFIVSSSSFHAVFDWIFNSMHWIARFNQHTFKMMSQWCYSIFVQPTGINSGGFPRLQNNNSHSNQYNEKITCFDTVNCCNAKKQRKTEWKTNNNNIRRCHHNRPIRSLCAITCKHKAYRFEICTYTISAFIFMAEQF